MARKRNQTQTSPLGRLIAGVIALIVVACGGYVTWEQTKPEDTPTSVTVDGQLTVQFIDVGQADSALITLPDGKHMLIDAGGNATADLLTDYLKAEGVSRLDYVVGTHPHEDHIGGLDKVIDRFDIGALYLPRVDDSQVPTTRTYEDVLTSIQNKGLKATQGKAGVTILDQEGLSAQILAPNGGKYPELNSYSIAVKLTYGQKSFLFMGDAEQDSEEEMLQKGWNLRADVLKCGHHGSSTSTSPDFLDAVNPQYAIFSCGVNNKYGHPHRETAQALAERNVTVYRTDQQQTITAVCDGSDITFQTGGRSCAGETQR